MRNFYIESIIIQYNLLNLPSQVNFNHTGQPINEYTYAMDGSKLQVNHKKSSGGKVTDYVGNMIYEGGSLKRILVDGGFYEEGKYYFYLRDHLGNNRVVADASGSAIQVTHYYPFGMSFTEGYEQDIKPAKQPYKYNGKELDGENSQNWYDYEARQLAMDVSRFTSIDPLSENYYSWSPYVYVANNPLKYIDPNGKDIVVLSASSGAGGLGHMAILVGSEEKGWTYISKDGTSKGKGASGESNYIVKEFSSLEEFSESAHNYQLSEGFHSTSDGTEADTFSFKLDKEGNKMQRYDHATLIETTQKDGTSTDNKTIEAATTAAKTDYDLSTANCADAVVAGLNVSRRSNEEKIHNGRVTGLSGDILGTIPNSHRVIIRTANAGKNIIKKISPKKNK